MQVNIRFAVLLAGFCVVIMSLIAMLGYALNLPSYYTIPSHRVAMSLPSASMFLVVGLCLMGLAKNGENK